MNRMLTAHTLWRVVRWGLVLTTATVAVFPFYWMLRTAVAGPDDVFFSGISLLPKDFDLGNFGRAWAKADLGAAMLNGALVTVTILACQLATCVPAAYAFAKLRFPGRGALYGLVLACLLVPTQATAIPLYLGIGSIGLGNTWPALVLPFTTSAFGIFLLRQYMVTIPDSLLEAARTDGLGTWATLWRVVVPMSAPAIATFAIFSIFVHWNDYLWPLLVARDQTLRTPPLALATFNQVDVGTDYAALAAGAVIITTPIILLFLLAQRRFVAGIAGGELPG
ncbi:binding-protein dependent transport system inner membrane protein [Candidatus Protofrankia californiensis]|uniref:Binding-protein dependent transport system inner membrane protein n=1 Tax=Candidatus Protofrankia californiensis TaxID=1839754 RepID=A0A1C3P952_9ACTN|nr:binding-protein dependent transport system inner membrane protein [Candidatus Protofrankia californiensis]